MVDLLNIGSPKEFLQIKGIRPSKLRGQHFLISENALNKIIEAAELKPTDVVLEIGPGLGTLTQELVKRAGQVVAVEKDARFVKILQDRFKDFKNLEIIHNDILKFVFTDNKRSSVICKREECSEEQFKNYKIVANIPYNITSDILIKFLEEEPRPERLVLMLQKEVADRILERNGRSSRLSIFVNYFGKPELVTRVPATAFYPSPKVDSAIIKITPNIEAKLRCTPQRSEGRKFSFDSLEGGKEKERAFFNFVRLGFSHPRKKLISSLKIWSKRNPVPDASRRYGAGVDQIQSLPEIFRKLNLDQNVRPENLHLEDWIRLFDALERP